MFFFPSTGKSFFEVEGLNAAHSRPEKLPHNDMAQCEMTIHVTVLIFIYTHRHNKRIVYVTFNNILDSHPHATRMPTEAFLGLQNSLFFFKSNLNQINFGADNWKYENRSEANEL